MYLWREEVTVVASTNWGNKGSIFSVHHNKSPGPDVIDTKFMKLHWDGIKFDLHKDIDEIFHSAKLPKGLNHTFISLIPKTDKPADIGDYRPIS